MTAPDLPAGFERLRVSGEEALVDRWSRRGVATLVGPLVPGALATGWAVWAGAHAFSGAHVRTSLTALVGVVALALAFGVSLLYLSLLGLVNRTTVQVSRSTITRKIGPLPWSGAASITRSAEQRIAVRERGSTRGRSYDVVVSGDGVDQLLFRWLRTAEDAERVAAALRDSLGRA